MKIKSDSWRIRWHISRNCLWTISYPSGQSGWHSRSPSFELEVGQRHRLFDISFSCSYELRLSNVCSMHISLAVATLYLQPEAVKLSQSSGILEGDEVMTVYGAGYVEKKRLDKNDLVVKLRNWALAQGQSPTCYLQEAAVVKIHHLKVGSIAKTVWGLVKIVEIRRDGQHVCDAVHWIMADGKPPRFYIAPEAFALMSLKP